MWLLNRRHTLLTLLAPLALAACGFSPVYGTGGAGQALQDAVLVDAPGNEDTYLMTREIEERLGRGGKGTYGLSLNVRTAQVDLAIDREGNTGRHNLLGNADYTLRDLATGQILTSGSVENFTAFSATGTTVVTLAGEQAARERLMEIMAEQIVTRLYTLPLDQ